ncbi:MAG: S41 family peptidase [Candidatus Acidiferrales bacterium]
MTKRTGLICTLLVILLGVGFRLAAQQKLDNYRREQAKDILKDIYDGVKKDYYDSKFHGIDLDARFKEYEGRIDKTDSLSHAFGIIAGFLEAFNDSHLFFIPPSRPMRLEYGYRMQIVGERAFITEVKSGTDAAEKLSPGDEVLGVHHFTVNREDLWKMNYYFNQLAPQPELDLVVRTNSGQEHEVTVQAKVRQLKRVLDLTGSGNGLDIWDLMRDEENQVHLVRQRYYEKGRVMFWQMPIFDLDPADADHMMDIVRKHEALVLDLRGNPGGRVDGLERLLGGFFDHDVKVGDRIGRKEMKPEIAKTRGGRVFSGKVVVLVDSRSASAAEIFARLMQLEHRGTVIGDRSSGSVMEARQIPYDLGQDTKVFFAESVTIADLIMTDGKSLEHNGVTPDEIILPTQEDLAKGRDPALARAAELVGYKLDPVEAGKMFPFEWPSQ